MAKEMREKPPCKILTPEQTRFLELVASEDYLCRNFYFTGGTPLSVFYLRHRLSEDIDLFSEREIYLPAIRVFIRKTQRQFKLRRIDYNKFLGLNSFQLVLPNHAVLKVDFNYYPFERIAEGQKYFNLAVDSVLDIAVNKTETIATQPRARDFIDLYFIISRYRYSLSDLLRKARTKFDWHIDYLNFGSHLLAARELKDYPRMIEPINHEEWKQFFTQEAKKLKKDIFE